MSLLTLCTTTATISRKSVAATDSGAENASFSAVYSGISCTIQPAPGNIREHFARMGILLSHRLYTPTAIELKAGDKCVDAASRTYQVVSSSNQAGRGEVYCAYLNEIDP